MPQQPNTSGAGSVALLYHVEKVMDEKDRAIQLALRAQEKALELQAAEYERRLDTLTNENDRIAKIAENCVSYPALYTSFTGFMIVLGLIVSVASIYLR